MAKQPHVRVEMRKVYVFAKNSVRTTKRAAYLGAARARVRDACSCSYETETGFSVTCRFHADCTCEPVQTAPDDFGPGYCNWHLKIPEHKRDRVGPHVYYVLVRDRLARFLAFVDSRSESEVG